MSITLTIKQVPQALADALRRRAEANHRSQQRELLLILERAVSDAAPFDPRISEPPPPAYAAKPSRVKRGKATRRPAAGKLGIEELWKRARKIGPGTPDESAAIVRRDRDARHSR